MKTLLISLTSVVYATVLFRSTRFDSLDLNSNKFDISWDDIIEDLWP